jgi:hypothetical protein
LNAPVAVGVPVMVPIEEMVKPGGRPVAVNVYGPPAPPLPGIVADLIAVFWTAVMLAQAAVGAAFTVTEQVAIPVLPAESFTVTV